MTKRPLTVYELALFMKENARFLPLNAPVIIATDPDGERFVPLSSTSLYTGSYLADPARPHLGGGIYNLPGAVRGDFEPAPEGAEAAVFGWPLY